MFSTWTFFLVSTSSGLKWYYRRWKWYYFDDVWPFYKPNLTPPSRPVSSSAGPLSHLRSCNLSRYLTVWCLVKYLPIRVFSVRLNLPTILALVSSLCVEKWRTPSSFNKASKDRLRNSSSLSVYSVIGLISDSNSINAITNDDADLFFSRMHHALFENTSITVSKNVIPSLSFFRFDTSTRSACHYWCGPPTTTHRRLNAVRTGLWSVYVSCSGSHFLMNRTGVRDARFSAATPP